MLICTEGLVWFGIKYFMYVTLKYLFKVDSKISKVKCPIRIDLNILKNILFCQAPGPGP